MLRTNLVDGEVRMQKEKENDLLPVLIESHVKATGTHGNQKVTQFERMKAITKGRLRHDAVGQTTSDCPDGIRRKENCR